MALDKEDFLGKLRTNQVLKPDGQGMPSPLIGMPDFYAGRQVPPYGGFGGGMGGNQMDTPLGPTQEIPHFFDFARQMETKKREDEARYTPKQIDLTGRPSAVDTFTNNILNPPERAGKFQLELLKESNKVDNNKANIGLKSRKLDLEEKIQSGKATDAEKNEYAKEILGIRGDQAMEQIGARGQQQENLLDMKGKQATSLQQLRGEQGVNLQNLRGEQSLNLQGLKGDQKGETTLSPSQERNNTNNNISKIIMESPELSKFLTKDPNTGQYSISPEANETTRALITSKINTKPTGNRDIALPAAKKSATPGSTKPVTTPKADPLGIR